MNRPLLAALFSAPALLAWTLAWTLAAGAQAPPDPSALRRAVVVDASPLYVAPDNNSTEVGNARPGEDVGVESTANGFVRLFNGVSGWMPNHGLVYLSDPQGAEVLFGAAVTLQKLAETGVAEQATAQDAARLFARVVDDFPTSPRAAEAQFRGADITWQIGLADQPRRRDPSMQEFPEDGALKKVESKYPNTPWAARAAFDLLAEHLTCGDLTTKPECVAKEVGIYEDYVKKYPTSPDAAQAAYQALFDAAVGATIYGGPTHPDAGKAKDYKEKVAADAQQVERQFPATDWAAKAALVTYRVSQGMPIYPPTVGKVP